MHTLSQVLLSSDVMKDAYIKKTSSLSETIINSVRTGDHLRRCTELDINQISSIFIGSPENKEKQMSCNKFTTKYVQCLDA